MKILSKKITKNRNTPVGDLLFNAIQKSNEENEKRQNEYNELLEKLRKNVIDTQELNKLNELYHYYDEKLNREDESNNKNISGFEQLAELTDIQTKILNIYLNKKRTIEIERTEAKEILKLINAKKSQQSK